MNKIVEASANREAEIEAPKTISQQAVAKREQTEGTLDVAPPPRAPRQKPAVIKEIATAIAAVTGEIGVVPKLGVNAYHHYKYAAMSDIVMRLNKLMSTHGLVVVQSELSRQWVDGGAAISITYEFTIAHSSGEMWPERPQATGLSRCRDSKGGFDDKSINKCHTAARKYFLISLFQIATGDEPDDADAGENEKPATRVVTSGPVNYPAPPVVPPQLAPAIAQAIQHGVGEPPKPPVEEEGSDQWWRTRPDKFIEAAGDEKAALGWEPLRHWWLTLPSDLQDKWQQFKKDKWQPKAREVEQAKVDAETEGDFK